MQFRTTIEIKPFEKKIEHSQSILSLGSCFASNVAERLSRAKFSITSSPTGILFNPESIASAIDRFDAVARGDSGAMPIAEELSYGNGRWFSFDFHSDFSRADAAEALTVMREAVSVGATALAQAHTIIITFGSAFVYRLNTNGKVVGNCHKQPDKTFRRLMLNAEAFVEECRGVLKKCREVNPNLKVLFTVSPIRHAKDGMHGNQLSKATLLLAIDEICRTCPDCFYFPSYEIIMDELRDYRFYADDMIHLSSKSVEYIWECFSRCYFSKETQAVMKEWMEIKKAIDHKPFRPDSDAYRAFLSQIVLKIMQMKEKFPYLEVQKEIELCESRLKL